MFFNRVWVKENSKARLRAPDRWNAVLVALIALLLIGNTTGSANFEFNLGGNSDSGFRTNLGDLFPQTGDVGIIGGADTPTAALFLSTFLAIFFVVLAVIICYYLFFGNILQVGTDGWFMCFARGESPTVGTMFGSFKFYGRALSTTLLRDVYIFLWMLLFLIPGAIKSYAYSMTTYILCDNPNLTASQALKLSEKMTDGYKGELFIMELSFFGWNLLNTLTLGILGILYVTPYRCTARAGAYLHLKQIAIQSGRLTPADFGDYTEPAPTPIAE